MQPFTPDTVRDIVGQGGYWSRASIAAAAGRTKTTHVINQIEEAVRSGMVERLWGWVGNQNGWVYTIEVFQHEIEGFKHA